jgi:hypothetical protein
LRWFPSACSFGDQGGIKLPLSIGIAFKLLLDLRWSCWSVSARRRLCQITLFESAMGPMIGASIVAISTASIRR